ncbi:HpcH/HpaI aldolase/citrate lyase family protein [Novosphingobium colocasiae]|uniref:CoA ester lyase n=1 Tax=Novosphingobium colocasiae TaxID=1256513 RepID=A0A918P7K0_9SPHN|nr:CoA ester lyase [Novosphingobium colocasiae]GGY89969.1 CoA ester lyase [Novosphingobium colocasiae]
MRLRSLLFVPGDSEKKFAKASGGNADVLILDLEDSVAPAVKPQARQTVAGWLDKAGEVPASLFVRPNPLDSGLIDDDLAAVVRPGLAGLLVPKANGGADIAEIAAKLDKLEAAAGMAHGTVKIAVVSTETPLAMFNLGSYTPPHPRLVGLTWGAEDLGAAIGATDNKEADGSWTFPYQVARAQCLFAAAAAGVTPIDTLYANFRDPEGLEVDCRRARRDGFLGRIAIHPDQVDTINRCFSPSEEEVAQARKIADAFAANPELGTIGIDGKMYDIPHLKAAHKTLAAAGEAA